MGLYLSVYVGPYVCFTNSVISTTMVQSKPIKACPIHRSEEVAKNVSYCPKCGTKIENITHKIPEHVRVIDKIIETLGISEDEFFDLYFNIQGFVDAYKQYECFMITQDSPHDISTERGAGNVFNFDLDDIKTMKDPDNKKYATFYRLIKVLDLLEIKYESNAGYIQYWS